MQLWDKHQETIGDVTRQTKSSLLTLRQAVYAESAVNPDIYSILSNYLVMLETDMQKVLSRRSPVFWSLLYGRLPDFYSPTKKMTESDKINCEKAQAYLRAAFINYGSGVEKGLSIGLGVSIQIMPVAQDIVDLCGRVHLLVWEIEGVKMLRRRAGRGGRLVLSDTGWLSVTLPSNLDECIRLYHRRQREFPDAPSPAGMLMSHEITFVDPLSVPVEDESLLFFNQATSADLYLYQGEYFIRNFVPCKLSLNFLKRLGAVEHKLQSKIGMTSAGLCQSLVALKNYLVETYSNANYAYTYLGRGSLYAVTDYLRTALERRLAKSRTSEDPTQIIRAFMDFLFGDLGQNRNEQSWDRCGSRLHAPDIDIDLCFLDLAVLPRVLTQLVFDLTLRDKTDGPAREKKGTEFENFLEEKLTHQENITFMRKNIKLKTSNRQIDLLVGSGQVLLAIECKALAVKKEYLDGDPQALIRRENQVMAALRQSTESARTLVMNHPDLISQNFTHVLPVVCSAFVEFWPHTASECFIAPGVPLVCSPSELTRLFSEQTIPSLFTHPKALEINRRTGGVRRHPPSRISPH
jgi:Holliday junction resolvase